MAFSISWPCAMDCSFGYGGSDFCSRIRCSCNCVELGGRSQAELLSQCLDCSIDCNPVDCKRMDGNQFAIRWLSVVASSAGSIRELSVSAGVFCRYLRSELCFGFYHGCFTTGDRIWRSGTQEKLPGVGGEPNSHSNGLAIRCPDWRRIRRANRCSSAGER